MLNQEKGQLKNTRRVLLCFTCPSPVPLVLKVQPTNPVAACGLAPGRHRADDVGKLLCMSFLTFGGTWESVQGTGLCCTNLEFMQARKTVGVSGKHCKVKRAMRSCLGQKTIVEPHHKSP